MEPLVFDNGSLNSRFGVASEEAPRLCLKNHDICNISLKENGNPVPRDSLVYPIERGVVTDWDAMEKIWSYCYNSLNVSSQDYAAILVDVIPGPKANREKMASIMFETFHVTGVCIYLQSVLALYSIGRTSGVIVESGDGVTQSVPIVEGNVVPHAIHTTHVAGRDITDAFSKYLIKEFDLPQDKYTHEDFRYAKEKLCLIAQDYEKQMRVLDSMKQSFELPDGKVIQISTWERFVTAEALFKPSLIGKESDGVHVNTINAIRKCDDEVKRTLYGSIVTSGGTSMINDFGDRLQKEVQALAPSTQSIKVTEPYERAVASWIGGSIVGSLTSFQEQAVKRSEYEEYGSNIVHRKFH
jgi:actin-related protein